MTLLAKLVTHILAYLSFYGIKIKQKYIIQLRIDVQFCFEIQKCIFKIIFAQKNPKFVKIKFESQVPLGLVPKLDK